MRARRLPGLNGWAGAARQAPPGKSPATIAQGGLLTATEVTQPQEIALYARRFTLLTQSAVSGRDARDLIQRALGEIIE